MFNRRQVRSGFRAGTARVAVAGILLAGASMVSFAGRASAAQYDCANGYFCIWANSSFTGNMTGVWYDYNSLVGTSVGPDNAESGFNRTGSTVRLHNDLDCAGPYVSFSPTVARASLAYPNLASSIDIRNGSITCGG